MKIGILGVGAIGGVIGGYLTKNKHDVTLIDLWPKNIEVIKEKGLTVTAPEGEFTVQATAFHLGEISSVKHEFDVVILSVKSYDTSWASKFIQPHLSPGGFILSAQNSINEDAIADVLGWPRIMGCVVTLGAGMYKPGNPERTSSIDRPAFTLGEPSGLITQRLERISSIMQDAGLTKTTTNLWGERWAKLATNSMSNAVAGFTGLMSAELRLHPEVRTLSIRIAAELISVANALGVSVEPIGAVPSQMFGQALENSDVRREVDSLMMEASKTIGTGRPSLAQDLLKGRTTEVDFLNGYVVRKGAEVGVPTPVNQAIVDLTHRVSKGEIQQSLSNIELV